MVNETDKAQKIAISLPKQSKGGSFSNMGQEEKKGGEDV